MNMTTITTSVGQLATDVGTAGAAVIGVVIAFAAFKWVRRAIAG